MNYRPYQLECFESICENYSFGLNTQLVVMATGLGKTRVMAGITDLQSRLGLFGKVFVLVNRVELAEQTKAEFEEMNPDLKVGIEQAENVADKDCHIVVGSVQTLGTAKFDEAGNPIYNERIQRINPDEYSIVLVDETHRAPAKTFRSVLMYFGVYQGRENYKPWKLLLGFTATPNRMDNKGLEEFYQAIASNYDIVWGIDNEWLTDIHAYRVSTSVNLDEHDIGTTNTEQGKDFNRKDLEKAINIPARNKLIIEKYLELHEGHRGIFFCVDVQHAKDLCAMANSMGVTGHCVFGSTNKKERQRLLSEHKAGKFNALFGVGCFVEGYNDPGIVVACMARPTQSKLFYQQAIGRALRPFPAPETVKAMRARGEEPAWIKQYAILIDFCDLSSKHNIVTVGSIFGMGAKFDCKGKSVAGEAKKVKQELCKLDEKQQAAMEEHRDDFADIEELRAIVEKIDLLRPPQVSQEIAKISPLEWIKTSANRHEISLPGKDVIKLEEGCLGDVSIWRSINGVISKIATKHDLKTAVEYAERELITDENFDLLRAEAKWRSNRPSDKQIEYLFQLRKDLRAKFSNDLKLFTAWAKQYSKGDLSNLIQEAKSQKARA